MVLVPSHRKALTGLLLGDHSLSVECLRYGARYRRPVPHIMRLCRFVGVRLRMRRTRSSADSSVCSLGVQDLRVGMARLHSLLRERS
ncbi:hypothetical protein B0H12DRAFT_1090849, partial [Mycena haematopus]